MISRRNAIFSLLAGTAALLINPLKALSSQKRGRTRMTIPIKMGGRLGIPTISHDLSLPDRASVFSHPQLCGHITVWMDGKDITDGCFAYNIREGWVTVVKRDSEGRPVLDGNWVEYEKVFAVHELSVYRSNRWSAGRTNSFGSPDYKAAARDFINRVSGTWSETTATPLTNINKIREIAKQRYGNGYATLRNGLPG